MTICIAAICTWGAQKMIVGASDRMLTAGDIEFEPSQSKIFALTPTGHVIALTAGDTAAQTEICTKTSQQLTKRTVTDIGEIADIYGHQFAACRRRRSEQAILAPLGLDIESFAARQREMLPQLVDRIATDLRDHKLEAETIITGVDASGGHIYVIRDPGEIARNDGVGFAAIGLGEWHAASQFMFRRYTSQWTFPRASMLTYSAKKRAEVAPGVGRETDMFYIGPGFSRCNYFAPELQEQLTNIYDNSIAEEEKSAERALKGFEQYVHEALRKAAAQAAAQAATPAVEERANNEEGIQGGTESS